MVTPRGVWHPEKLAPSTRPGSLWQSCQPQGPCLADAAVVGGEVVLAWAEARGTKSPAHCWGCGHSGVPAPSDSRVARWILQAQAKQDGRTFQSLLCRRGLGSVWGTSLCAQFLTEMNRGDQCLQLPSPMGPEGHRAGTSVQHAFRSSHLPAACPPPGLDFAGGQSGRSSRYPGIFLPLKSPAASAAGYLGSRSRGATLCLIILLCLWGFFFVCLCF